MDGTGSDSLFHMKAVQQGGASLLHMEVMQQGRSLASHGRHAAVGASLPHMEALRQGRSPASHGRHIADEHDYTRYQNVQRPAPVYFPGPVLLFFVRHQPQYFSRGRMHHLLMNVRRSIAFTLLSIITNKIIITFGVICVNGRILRLYFYYL